MNTKKMIARLIEIQEELDAVKPLYNEMDELVAELAEDGFKAEEFKGCIVLLIDNFSQKNVVWKAAAVRRYEIKIEKKAA